ncbi:serine hydrolase [Micromonospora siamensis]|uniref:Beta-lactamase class A n=1 Tax=Micromonospora siamensis TaxID=299152 RepID=A0A1C5JFJ2_9ACTN|nr:serine hydrolase [Micromonospora siamensis]SCG68999.1 beta-lactamase class A [Micromonospora siamensis]
MIWAELDAHLAKVPGTVSAYVGRPGAAPAWTRLPDATHYAASTMKVAVLVALLRAAEAGELDLDTPIPVVNEFDSALPGAPRFGCDRDYDNDEAVWERVGGTASPRWLAQRMIVRSSNLATNIVLGLVGLPAVARAWTLGGARHSATGRGIEDFAAREAGITNPVTAADLAALLGALALGARRPGPLASPAGCAAMLDVLCAQEFREDIAAGLPEGTRIAHKNGWVRGVRHGAGVVFPDDAPPYVIVVCTTTDLADGGPSGEEVEDDACRLIANVSARVWAARHDLPA